MKQLEDRIKDRLEGYESRLPEGDLAEFKALLDASSTSEAKHNPAFLAWLAPVVAAAAFALFFILGHSPQQDVIQAVDDSSLMADATLQSPAEVDNLAETEPIIDAAAGQTNTIIPRSPAKHDVTVAESAEPENAEAPSGISEQSTPKQISNDNEHIRTDQKEEEKRKDAGSSMNSSTGYSPFVPAGSNNRRPVSVKVGRATAGVLAGTGAIALARALPSIFMNYDSDYGLPMHDPVDPGGIISDPEPRKDVRTCKDTHYLPLHTGLSVRIPFWNRWYLTTGLDYSWYASELEYSFSGIHNQNVHYLGFPLRADFTIARNRWMDVYVGAGGSMDLCIAAYDVGQKIAKDGIGFSLIGAGGIQFNISKNFGLFLDPTFSWNIPSDNRVLDTYRTENPFMLAVSTGLRFTIQTKH